MFSLACVVKKRAGTFGAGREYNKKRVAGVAQKSTAESVARDLARGVWVACFVSVAVGAKNKTKNRVAGGRI